MSACPSGRGGRSRGGREGGCTRLLLSAVSAPLSARLGPLGASACALMRAHAYACVCMCMHVNVCVCVCMCWPLSQQGGPMENVMMTSHTRASVVASPFSPDPRRVNARVRRQTRVTRERRMRLDIRCIDTRLSRKGPSQMAVSRARTRQSVCLPLGPPIRLLEPEAARSQSVTSEADLCLPHLIPKARNLANANPLSTSTPCLSRETIGSRDVFSAQDRRSERRTDSGRRRLGRGHFWPGPQVAARLRRGPGEASCMCVYVYI